MAQAKLFAHGETPVHAPLEQVMPVRSPFAHTGVFAVQSAHVAPQNTLLLAPQETHVASPIATHSLPVELQLLVSPPCAGLEHGYAPLQVQAAAQMMPPGSQFTVLHAVIADVHCDHFGLAAALQVYVVSVLTLHVVVVVPAPQVAGRLPIPQQVPPTHALLSHSEFAAQAVPSTFFETSLAVTIILSP